ncbi:MAG: cell division protein [Cyclobacteriaceae bacterium]
MALKRKVKKVFFLSLTAIAMFVMIAFAGKRTAEKPVNDVKVNIERHGDEAFTDQMEVLSLLNAEATDYVLGLSMEQLDLKLLEQRVESHPFVKDAQVYKDIKGNLVISVDQAQPIARIFDPSGADYYIDMDGYILPVSSRYTARVPIIQLDKFQFDSLNINYTDYGKKFMGLLEFISNDPFWEAQIAQLNIDKSGEITMLPQVTKQDISFGQPEDIASKFKKLSLFYKNILPNKGWNTYSSVNLKFKNQIICE